MILRSPLPRSLSLLFCLAVSACSPAKHPIMLGADDATYPFTLTSPSELSSDFMVRQAISVSIVAGGEKREGKLDAVLQKHGDSLLIVGLGPMNTRAFVIEYRDGHVRYEHTNKSMPALPIAPRALVVDVERVYLAHLPIPAETFSGRLEGTINGERVTEDWALGTLRRRSFAREGRFEKPIVIEFGAGYTTKNPDPHRIVLDNPWLGYKVTIVSEGAEPLD